MEGAERAEVLAEAVHAAHRELAFGNDTWEHACAPSRKLIIHDDLLVIIRKPAKLDADAGLLDG
jgi:hypothetical protein